MVDASRLFRRLRSAGPLLAAGLSAGLALASCSNGAGSGRTDPPSGTWWAPAPGLLWDIQLGDPVDLSPAVAAYDLDWETPAAEVAALHARGVKAICYFSAGTYEPGRPDAASYPAAIIGAFWAEWGEYYVDVRAAALRTVLGRRLDACRAAGFDGVDPDNVDAYEAGLETGFPLTEADGLAFTRWLGEEAHARGLAVFQKSAAGLAVALAPLYDGAVTEDCFVDGWCAAMDPYPAAGKPVLMIEYTDRSPDLAQACALASSHRFSLVLKDRGLTSSTAHCQ